MSENKELSLQQHAMQEIDAVAAGLDDLTAKYKGVVYDVSTTKGMADAKAARLEIREPRYAVERIRKGKVSELSAISKAINTRAAEITAQITTLEDPIDGLIKAEEDRKAAEKAERERIEAERVQKQQDALAEITGALGKLFGAGVEELTSALDELDGLDLSQFDDVFRPSAEKALADALAAINRARDERIALDQQAAELRRQQEEQEKRDREAAEQRRKDDEAAQAERDRLARDAQAKADAEAEERRVQREKEDKERADRQAEEDRKRQEQADADRAAREAAQKVLDDRQAELDRQAEEQRQRDAKAAHERREAQDKADKEQRDREATEQAEAVRRAAAEEEAAIQAATARQAMEEAVDFLSRLGHADHITTRKLAAVLSKESA